MKTKKILSYLLALVVCSLVFFMETFIDNVFPRVKVRTMLAVTWGVILVSAGTNLVVLSVLR